MLLGNRYQLLQSFDDVIIVNISAGSRLQIAKDTDIWCAELLCQPGIFCDLFFYVVKFVLEFQAGAGGETGDLQA